MKVLVCTDFSAGAAAGERETARRWPDAEIILFHAIDSRLPHMVENLTKYDADELKKDMSHYADMRMNEIVKRLTSEGRRAVAEIVEGDPVESALAAAARMEAQLIVVGVAPGVPVGRFRIQLARQSSIPVLLVPV